MPKLYLKWIKLESLEWNPGMSVFKLLEGSQCLLSKCTEPLGRASCYCECSLLKSQHVTTTRSIWCVGFCTCSRPHFVLPSGRWTFLVIVYKCFQLSVFQVLGRTEWGCDQCRSMSCEKTLLWVGAFLLAHALPKPPSSLSQWSAMLHRVVIL